MDTDTPSDVLVLLTNVIDRPRVSVKPLRTKNVANPLGLQAAPQQGL